MNLKSNSKSNNEKIIHTIEESALIIGQTKNLINEITKTVNVIIRCFKKGNKVVTLGNGGSAADAQHLAAEFIGRYLKERISLPAVSLTTDTSILTAIGNDYGFDYVFSRQCESIIRPGDVVIAFTTSGKSKNVINALLTSKRNGAFVIAMTGENGKELSQMVDILLIAPSKSTPRIQEAHRTLMHIICEHVENEFHNNKK